MQLLCTGCKKEFSDADVPSVCNVCIQSYLKFTCQDCNKIPLEICTLCKYPICSKHQFNKIESVGLFCLHPVAYEGQSNCAEMYVKSLYRSSLFELEQ